MTSRRAAVGRRPPFPLGAVAEAEAGPGPGPGGAEGPAEPPHAGGSRARARGGLGGSREASARLGGKPRGPALPPGAAPGRQRSEGEAPRGGGGGPGVVICVFCFYFFNYLSLSERLRWLN